LREGMRIQAHHFVLDLPAEVPAAARDAG